MNFLGVIFDMDGVLCDSERFICEAACAMFQQNHACTVQPHDFEPFVGTGENRYIGGVAEKYGVKLDLDRDKAATYKLYLDLIKGRLDPLPGAREFIAECRRRGMKLAVASSADKIKVEGNLTQIGLPWSGFDAVVNGLDVERKKPHPDIFQLAARKLGLPNEKCLVVEDAPSGLKAGKAAGSKCLGLTTSFDEKTLREAGADWIAPDLAHVPREVLGR
jgi:beta-phosphoglucomutase